MATARPFAYNTGSPISGTEQIGNLAIGFPTNGFSSTGLEWWNGPDEELGYVIAQEVPDDSQPTPVPGITGASVGFFRSEFLTEASFIEIAEVIAGPSGGGPFSTGSDAKTWLNENGYWTSYSSPVTSGLVLYYDPSNPSSYSGSGTTLNDLSDSGLNGTMSNILFSDPYFEYNGSSSQVSAPDSPLLEPGSGSWTMEAWFYVDSFSSSSVILGKFDDGGLSQDVSYSIRVNTAGNLFAQYSDGSPSAFVNSTIYSLNAGETYQAVYVWTNSGSTKTLETFINGVSIGSVNHSFNSIVNSTNPLYLGSYNDGEFPQWLNGGIGITRLYNKSLSSSEVLQNYNADKNKYGL
jgi:hypothetical protein